MSIFLIAQTPTASPFGDDQANWSEMWKVMSKSNDARLDVADSRRPSLFDLILRANAEARRKFEQFYVIWMSMTIDLPLS